MHICPRAKYRLCLSDFNQTWIFSTDFQKIQISNFMKICPVRAELFHTDGGTDRQRERQAGRHDEANIHFSQFYRIYLIKCFDAHWWQGFLKLFTFWILSFSRALCTVLNRYSDVWIYAHMREPCRATESTSPKGETIEVVIESGQPLVVTKLWHVPPPTTPKHTHTHTQHSLN
jgi:hypothetical protein